MIAIKITINKMYQKNIYPSTLILEGNIKATLMFSCTIENVKTVNIWRISLRSFRNDKSKPSKYRKHLPFLSCKFYICAGLLDRQDDVKMGISYSINFQIDQELIYEL